MLIFRKLFFFIPFFISIIINAQVGINTSNPNGILEVVNTGEGNKYGIVLPISTDSITIQNPTNNEVVSGSMFFNKSMDQALFRDHKHRWVAMNGIVDHLASGSYLKINDHFVEVPKGSFFLTKPKLTKVATTGNFVFDEENKIVLPNGSYLDVQVNSLLLSKDYVATNPIILNEISRFFGEIWSFHQSKSRVKLTSLGEVQFLPGKIIQVNGDHLHPTSSYLKIDLNSTINPKYFYKTNTSYFTLNKKFTIDLTRINLLVDIDDDLNEVTQSFYKFENNNIEFQSSGTFTDGTVKRGLFGKTSNFNYSNNYNGRIFKIDSLARLHFLSEDFSLRNTALLEEENLHRNTFFTPNAEIESRSVYNICKISGESNGTVVPNNVLEANKIFIIGFSPALVSSLANLQSSNDSNDTTTGGSEGIPDINTGDIDGLATSTYNSMNKNATRNFLWSDLDEANNPSHMRDSFLRIEYILKSVVLPGSTYYNNANVIAELNSALDWLYVYRYNHETNAYVGNWWFWEIGVGIRIANIVTLGKGVLDNVLLNKLVDESIYYSPDDNTIRLHDPIVNVQDPNSQLAKDANKSNLTYISTIRNAFKNNTANFVADFDSFRSQMVLSTGYNDGPLPSGDFMHYGFAYNGGYGRVFWQDAVKLFILFKSSGLAIDAEVEDFLLSIFKTNFAPFTYKGNGLQAFIGRGVSRKSEDFYAAKEIYNQGLLLAKCVNRPGYSDQIQKVAKHQISNFGLENWKKRAYNAYISSLIDEVFNNNSIVPEYNYNGPLIYPISDRVIFREARNTSTISMYSKRTKNYESINGENFKGFYQAYGMLLNHPDHTSTFHDFYWPAADYKRLPGTTTTNLPLSTETSPTGFTVGVNAGLAGTNNFSNSVKLDNFSFTANHLIGLQPDDITANKSWLMTNGSITHLVSNIKSTGPYSTKTVVDFRKTTSGGGSQVTFNNAAGSRIIRDMAPTYFPTAINTIFIQGVEDTNRGSGYIFPSTLGNDRTANENINGSFDIKFLPVVGAKYRDINTTGDELTFNRSYYYIERYHGIQPNGSQSFSFIQLPSTTKVDLQTFYANNPITVLRNNLQHVLSYKISANETLYGLANFDEGSPSIINLNAVEQINEVEVSPGTLYILKIDRVNKKVKLAFADPTFEHNQVQIKLKNAHINGITGDISRVISSNYANNSSELVLDVNLSYGKTFMIEFNYQ